MIRALHFTALVTAILAIAILLMAWSLLTNSYLIGL
jgi:hypothetical protein